MSHEVQWRPGSADGLARLEDFLSTQLAEFSHNKAKVDRSVTSRLSPWIHYGSISVRHIYHRVSLAAYHRYNIQTAAESDTTATYTVLRALVAGPHYKPCGLLSMSSSSDRIQLVMVVVALLLQIRAKQREWLSQGIDNSSHCQDFIKQLAYREYSRWDVMSS